MEGDEIQRQVCKFQRVFCNGSTTSDNNHKIAAATHKVNDAGDGDGGGGVARLCGWPSSRIVRVSRASGGKDRHSKVLTSKGLRDRRVRLSVSTAIQFYDLQDRLGYDQPSKAVEWLLKAASTSIEELPSLDASFPGAQQLLSHEKKSTRVDAAFEDPNQHQNKNNNNISLSKSSACSSTSETSKGSGLSLSRSENRVKARERAREMAREKEKEKEIESSAGAGVLNNISQNQNSSFTDLLTGGISRSPMDYGFGRSPQIIQMPQFNMAAAAGDNHNHNHQFSFLQENFGGGESYNLNFSMGSSSPGFNRGTLQSNLPSSLMAQRFQSPVPMDGSAASTNLPFFIVPNGISDQFPAAYDPQRPQPCYGGGGHSDQHKNKSKN